MSDFFATLELELRNAAARPPRRRAPGLRTLAPAAIVAALLALALVPVLALLGDGEPDQRRATAPGLAPVGTVYEPGEGTPPRVTRSTVVATGEAPVAGAWQLEEYRSDRLADPETGEEYQPAGLPCLGVFLIESRPQVGGGGACGEFPSTPGFGRIQMSVPGTNGDVREALVFGRVPARASSVVIEVDGKTRRTVEPFPGPPGVDGDFYLIAIPSEWDSGRVNWLDAHGNAGSRGHQLLPAR
jgi:hypothetical protein